jgi:hypothetical protein
MPKIKISKQIHDFKTLEYYTGSLDFPCDFCGKNSYANYHLSGACQILQFVVCEDCLKKAKRTDE